MAEAFPAIQLLPRSGGRAGAVWEGFVQPLRDDGLLSNILDDLEHDRPVAFDGDQLVHSPECEADHCVHEWIDAVKTPQQEFKIRIHYQGGPAVPRCYVLTPDSLRGRTPHMWWDGAICAFLASSKIWVGGRDTVADAVPFFLIWLVKSLVFHQAGHWPGAEHEHGPSYHLGVVGRRDPCWCGSGQSYKRCHMPADKVAAQNRSVFPRTSRG